MQLYSIFNNINTYTVLLSAGIHPEEEAPVIYLKQVIETQELFSDFSDFRFIVVPCRNYLGYTVVNRVLKSDNTIVVYADKLCKVLKKHDEYLVIPSLKLIEKSDKTIQLTIVSALQKINVKGYIHIVSFSKNKNIHANTYFFDSHRLVDINQPLKNYPKDIVDYEGLIAKYQPDLIIDLHEGKNEKVYFYVDKGKTSLQKKVKEAINALKYEKFSLREFANDRELLFPGCFNIVGLQCSFFQDYAPRSEMVILEGGILNDYNERIRAIDIGVRSLLMSTLNENNDKTSDNTSD